MATLPAVLALSEAERLALISAVVTLAVIVVSSVIGPIVVARVSRKAPTDPAAALDEREREADQRETRCLAALSASLRMQEWLVERVGSLEDAAGLPRTPPPPVLDEVMAEIEGLQ